MARPDPKRILLADPSDGTRGSLSRVLRGKGFETIEVADGSRALAETLLRRPDVLLLDSSLSVLSPERLLQILRTNPNTRGIPVFFLSAEERSVPGFRPGMDQFIRKPYHEDEVVHRLQRALFRDRDRLGDVLSGDSEIRGSLSQFSLPDLWQMLSMNRNSGVVHVSGDRHSGTIHIDEGEIVAASCQNASGRKALYRLLPQREGKFRFLPGRVEIRRTIHGPSQHEVLESLRQHDELRNLADRLPRPEDSVERVPGSDPVAGGGVGPVREVLLLTEFCRRVGELVNHCDYPDLVVYRTLLDLRDRGLLRIGAFPAKAARSDFLSPDEMGRLRTRLEEGSSFSGEAAGRIVFFLPDPSLLEEIVLALGLYREFEADAPFFSLRRENGIPLGRFGSVRIGEKSSLRLYAFPYLRDTSPLWYALAPRPLGIVAFLKDEVSSSLEALLAVSEYTRGADIRTVLAILGRGFTNFGLGANTVRLFQSRIEKLGCTLKIRELEKVSPEEIRESLGRVVRQYLERESG